MSVSGVTALSRPQQWVVYRCSDESGRLVYVGQTNDLYRRAAQHRSQTWWWSMVADIYVEAFADEESAKVAEKAAITSERPTFNKNHCHGFSTKHWLPSDRLKQSRWHPWQLRRQHPRLVVHMAPAPEFTPTGAS